MVCWKTKIRGLLVTFLKESIHNNRTLKLVVWIAKSKSKERIMKCILQNGDAVVYIFT